MGSTFDSDQVYQVWIKYLDGDQEIGLNTKRFTKTDCGQDNTSTLCLQTLMKWPTNYTSSMYTVLDYQEWDAVRSPLDVVSHPETKQKIINPIDMNYVLNS